MITDWKVEEGLVDLIVLLGCFGALLALLYGPWQTYCEDRARQHLFEARSRIFDLAAEGQISFESEEYKEIRRCLNCLIRYAHHLTWQRMIAYSIFLKLPKNPINIFEVVNRIEEENARLAVEREIGKAINASILLLIYRSPCLWPIFILLSLIRPYVLIVNRCRDLLAHRLQSNAESFCGNARLESSQRRSHAWYSAS